MAFDWNTHLDSLTETTVSAVQALVDAELMPLETAKQLQHYFNAVNKFRQAKPQVVQPAETTRPEIQYREETYLNFSPKTTIAIPDVMAMDTRPNIHTIRLSFGLINLDHVGMLDVKERTLLIQGHQRKLDAVDVRRLVAAMKLYQ